MEFTSVEEGNPRSIQKETPADGWCFFLEATPRLELGVELLQSSALPLGYVAIWITEAIACFCYHLLEQVTRLELATSTLARWRSTR